MSPKNGEIRLCVIVPVYGNWCDTLKCLDLLSRQDTRDFHVIVSDDGSPEPAPPGLAAFAFVQYLRNPHGGFAANCNAAARQARARGATHFFFLNNDTAFGNSFIAGWLRQIAERPDAIFSPNVYWLDKPNSVWFSGGKNSIWVPFFRLTREYRELTPVDIVCGCALLVPVPCWLEAEGFDETYVTYYEDFDFVLRAKAGGTQAYIAAQPELRVLHKVSRSFHGTGVWKKQYRLLASRLLFIRRQYAGMQRYTCFTLLAAQIAATLLLHPWELPRLRLLRAAIAEGLAGRGERRMPL